MKKFISYSRQHLIFEFFSAKFKITLSVETIKNILLNVIYHFGINKIIQFVFWRKKIIILAYHGFTDKDFRKRVDNYGGKHINIERFKEQIKFLKNNYNVISMEQLVSKIRSGSELPDNTAIITIDDGYESNYGLAFPILKEFGVPATIFITTSFIEDKEILWVDRVEYSINTTKLMAFELTINNNKLFFDCNNAADKATSIAKVKEMIKNNPQEMRQKIIDALENETGQKLSFGRECPEIYKPLEWHQISEMLDSSLISIGNHTHTHTILTRFETEKIKNELHLSKMIIGNNISRDSRLFCYPNGEYGDFDNQTRKLVKEFGFSCALTNVSGVNDKYTDLYELKRICINSKMDLLKFSLSLTRVFELVAYPKKSTWKLLSTLKNNIRNKYGILV